MENDEVVIINFFHADLKRYLGESFENRNKITSLDIEVRQVSIQLENKESG